MIVATAGHIDHGKTSLVRALTGVDTDRTVEEKRRGMSIDLGFAYAPFGQDEPLGFVDVPGHERFIRNMLAGVAAIDLALLVVAADDGPMPQTFEHLAVLDLLGVQACVVALTKIDRVSESRLAAARVEVQGALAGFDRGDAPIFPVSVTEGTGLPSLVTYLRQAQQAHTQRQRSSSGCFRLAVDRSFVAPGAGLVVTGAVLAGSCAEGEILRAWPHGVEVRVRSIRSQGRPASLAVAGERCALNLAGLELKRFPIERGDWITAPDAHAPSGRIDTRLRMLASCAKSLPDGAKVQLHIGAAERQARVALLGERALAPGVTGWAQLILDTPIHAVHGDRFVIRDGAARRVIGGGVIVEPIGAVRGRARPERMAWLAAMTASNHSDALAGLVVIQPDGVDLNAFAGSRGLSAQTAAALAHDQGLQTFTTGGPAYVVSADGWARARETILRALGDWHLRDPQNIGPSEEELAVTIGNGWRVTTPLFRALLRTLLDERQIARKVFRWQLSTHEPRPTPQDAALLDRVTQVLERSGSRPPIVGELATQLALPLVDLISFLQRMSTLGFLIKVAKNRWFLPATIEVLTRQAQALCAASADGKFDAAAFRDVSGLGRNLTIELLEFLDRSQVTRFDGARRSMAGTS